MRPTESRWVSASRCTPPLSSRMTDRPDARRSIAIVIPAAPAPAMQTSASSVVPSVRVRASTNMRQVHSFDVVDRVPRCAAEGHLAWGGIVKHEQLLVLPVEVERLLRNQFDITRANGREQPVEASMPRECVNVIRVRPPLTRVRPVALLARAGIDAGMTQAPRKYRRLGTRAEALQRRRSRCAAADPCSGAPSAARASTALRRIAGMKSRV